MTRLNFTTATQREALKRANGICECHLIPHVFPIPCGRPIGAGNTFFEHIDPDQLRKDNSLSNCAVLTRTCFKFKTSKFDLPIIAEAKRKFDAHHGIRDPWKKALPGTRASGIKKPFRGPPIDRRTGEPWRPGK